MLRHNKKHPDIQPGDNFNDWSVIELNSIDKVKGKLWNVRCKCGFEKVLQDSELKRGRTKQCRNCYYQKLPGTRHIDYSKQKVGKWSVDRIVGKTKNNNVIWLCTCECGNIRRISATTLSNGGIAGCGECNHYEEIKGNFWSTCIRGAAKRHLEFKITLEYVWNIFIQQNRKCALTGLDIYFSQNSKKKLSTASLDRIDSNKGYIEGNVQWLHKDINKLKQNFSEDYLIYLCDLILKQNKARKI